MVRSELVARIAGQYPHLYARDVETILAIMADALAQGGRVELRGFGVFESERSVPGAIREQIKRRSDPVAAMTSGLDQTDHVVVIQPRH